MIAECDMHVRASVTARARGSGGHCCSLSMDAGCRSHKESRCHKRAAESLGTIGGGSLLSTTLHALTAGICLLCVWVQLEHDGPARATLTALADYRRTGQNGPSFTAASATRRCLPSPIGFCQMANR